jgi:hypothetical protein
MSARVSRLAATVERRLLVNFRADPDVVRRVLPTPFEPHVVNGASLVGVCLIRLGGARPARMPRFVGLTSEHAAHRIAVQLHQGQGPWSGVYIPRRDSDSRLAVMASRRFFSGGVHLADFTVEEEGDDIRIAVASRDAKVDLVVDGRVGRALPPRSVFADVEEASRFFRRGSAGYSDGVLAGTYDGVQLAIPSWSVRPFDVREVHSSFFEDAALFPRGSVEFDNALLMQGVESTWDALPPLSVGTTPRFCGGGAFASAGEHQTAVAVSDAVGSTALATGTVTAGRPCP